MRALFTADFLLSVLLAILSISLLFAAFHLQLQTLSSQLSVAALELEGIGISDKLLFSCPEAHGIAACDSGNLQANGISKEAPAGFGSMAPGETRKFLDIGEGKAFEISAYLPDGKKLLLTADGRLNGNVVCIKRIGFIETSGADGKETAILKVCLSPAK